jgi:hypothetical protein
LPPIVGMGMPTYNYQAQKHSNGNPAYASQPPIGVPEPFHHANGRLNRSQYFL